METGSSHSIALHLFILFIYLFETSNDITLQKFTAGRCYTTLLGNQFLLEELIYAHPYIQQNHE